jgi:hypothetical protein
MPHYFFHLRTPRGTVRDLDGLELPDEDAAWDHAQTVARELLRQREVKRRSWQIVVCDQEQRRCSNLLFATIDDSMDHLAPDLRYTIEGVCARTAALNETFETVRLSALQLKATLAQFDGAPYLVVTNGRVVDEAVQLASLSDHSAAR